jgi:transposase-like protein
MSSKKITDADKLEIVDLYRQSGETTASLANRYGVSNSTISRLLKTNIPEAEYDILIQQKRGSKVGEDDSFVAEEPKLVETTMPTMPTEVEIADRVKETISEPELEIVAQAQENISESKAQAEPQITTTTAPPDLVAASPSAPISTSEDNSTNSRRVRRRSSAPVTAASEEPSADKSAPTEVDPELLVPKTPVGEDRMLDGKENQIDSRSVREASASAERLRQGVASNDMPIAKTIIPSPIPRTPVLQEILSDSQDRYFKPPVVTPPLNEIPMTDESDDDEPEDVNALAAMFGEEISDGEDDDEDDAEDWEEDSADSGVLDRNQLLTSDRLHIQVRPLSQATLPRTCYIVVDKFAELIVRPLKDFADLGQIPSTETQQRTLPVFDNPRVAKRFSNQRTQRVIKVPDSRVFYKTSEHLRLKGIACLLVDGNIYSLN